MDCPSLPIQLPSPVRKQGPSFLLIATAVLSLHTYSLLLRRPIWLSWHSLACLLVSDPYRLICVLYIVTLWFDLASMVLESPRGWPVRIVKPIGKRHGRRPRGPGGGLGRLQWEVSRLRNISPLTSPTRVAVPSNRLRSGGACPGEPAHHFAESNNRAVCTG